MTTNDALTNPLSATLPVPEVPSLLLFRSTLAIKMAGHAVVGEAMGRRPRSVWLNPRDGVYGTYRLDRPKADAERSAMVALGGYVALNIAESMNETMSKGFCESALCTDVHHASMYFPTEENNRPALALRLLPIVQDLLESEWEKVKIVAAYLHEHGMIDGATLGRLASVADNIEVPGPQVEDAQVFPIASPAVPMKAVDAHEGASVQNAERTQVNPAVPKRVAGKYDPEFLRETLADIEARALTLEEGVAFLKPTRMQERALRALARGGMSTDEALEIFTVTPSQK